MKTAIKTFWPFSRFRIEGRKQQNFEILKLIILIFHVKQVFEILGELDVRVVACNFQVFGIFLFISDFFRLNSFIFEPKVEKKDMGVFSTQFQPQLSIMAPKIMAGQNN